MAADPSLRMSSGSPIPQLALGLYKIPADEEGERIIVNAVKVRRPWCEMRCGLPVTLSFPPTDKPILIP